jgi:hypothetical protein
MEDAMRTDITRVKLAGFGGLPQEVAEVCQRILAARSELAAHLCCNPELTTSVWLKLWGSKRPSADQAKDLVSRPLDRELRAVVIRRETRTTVLERFLAYNHLERDEQELLAGQSHAGELLLAQRWFHRDLRKPVALRVKGLQLLEDLAYAPLDTYSDAEINTLLLSYGQWIDLGTRGRQMRTRYALLRVLFGRRPSTIAVLFDPAMPEGSPLNDLLTSAAGSANVTAEQSRLIAKVGADGSSALDSEDIARLSYCLLALLANPRCPHDVAKALLEPKVASTGDIRQAARRRLEGPVLTGSLSAINDAEHISWLVKRSMPRSGDYGYRPARPIELLELARNTHLPAELVEQVTRTVGTDIDRRLLDEHRVAIEALYPNADLATDSDAFTPVAQNSSTPQYIRDALNLAALRLGTDPVRWETLIGLIDDYDGEFSELVELAENI